jgi:ATP-dependent DNA helicase RecQ
MRTKRPTIAAFTATATTQTIDDITSSLDLTNWKLFKQDELPDHLHWSIVPCTNLNHKIIKLLQILSKHRGQAGIIYTLTRQTAEEVATMIKKIDLHNWWGEVGYYHGGMSSIERETIQKKFVANQLKIIIATNAFGMGVDKPDIRFVIHYHLPNSLEAYSQEVGRAGRDREAADCYLLVTKSDLKINFQLATNQNKIKALEHIIRFSQLKSCLKNYLGTYFSLTYSKPNCLGCSNCLSNPLRNESSYQIYLLLVEWARQISKHKQLDPAFVLSQYQAALISILKPRTIEHFQRLPSFGTGWIRDCWPLLKDDKIYEIIKEKAS